ncbi:MAG: TetR/AcrR family transcriptional regulator [Solirubrobacterales bacterium]|nr:TetR/AcrR family transcriptional regulator [Solirubrobacterales bacterium]
MKPLRADAERNRRLVLEAAAQAFAEEGFDVGVAEIARRAGVGNATVFRRFPTKDALFDAIVEDRIATLEAAAQEAALEPDPWKALVAFLEAGAAMQARDHGFFQATEQRLLKHPEILEKHRCVVDAVEPLVVRAQEAGVLRDDIGTTDVLGLMKAAVACLPPHVREQAWRRPLAMFLDGLRPGAATPLPVPALSFEDLEAALQPHYA